MSMKQLDRRSFLRYAAQAAAAGAAPLWLSRYMSGSPWASGEMKLLRGQVGYYVERGGTIGYFQDRDVLGIVDTQFPDTAGHLLERLRELGEAPVDLLVNTHHHGDHTGGNILFRDLVRTHVAHENARNNLERVATERNELDKQLLPTTTYHQRWSHRLGSEIVSLYYFGPAHTNGDSLVHFENANVAHMGDLVFNRRFPYIDRTAGASIENWIDVLRKARRTFDRDTLYLFGHAAEGYSVTGTHADLKAMGHYLGSLLKFVARSQREGKTLEWLKANVREIPGAPEWKGDGIARSLDAAWAELEGR